MELSTLNFPACGTSTFGVARWNCVPYISLRAAQARLGWHHGVGCPKSPYVQQARLEWHLGAGCPRSPYVQHKHIWSGTIDCVP